MRGIVIAGTHSGSGKTTVALGIMAALRKKGFSVQPFKAGPDFIDAGLHRIAAGRASRNLDLWMCGQEYVNRCFRKHASDVDFAVIEGVMGLYDGERSTASLARHLNVPVVLVVDAYGMAESAGAIVRGFAEFGVQSSESGSKTTHYELPTPNSQLLLAGVVFNRVASENHFARLKQGIRDVPVLGYIPRDMDFEIPHRHLGLTTAEESPLGCAKIEKLADTVVSRLNIDEIIKKAELPIGKDHNHEGKKSPKNNHLFRIAMAFDKAFSFYYEDNLDLLRDAGVEIIRFSPLVDQALPQNADVIYIGGGYPEIHAKALSGNTAMLASLRFWADAGKPIYAECGGLMYLSKGIHDFDNGFVPMVGVFPFETRMMKKPRLGYREITLIQDCILGNKGETVRGHEFHYSEIVEGRGPGNIYTVTDASGHNQFTEGLQYKNTLASYVHVHFGSNPRIAERFAAFVKESVIHEGKHSAARTR